MEDAHYLEQKPRFHHRLSCHLPSISPPILKHVEVK